MDWLKICADYYNKGYYDNDSLKIFVAKNKISEDDYMTITGITYLP